jgi:hypothetical protein
VAKRVDLCTRVRYDEKRHGTGTNKCVHFTKTLETRGFVTDPIVLPTSKAGRLSKGDLMQIKMAEFDINSDALRRINDPDMGSKHALMLPPAETLENVTLFVSEPALTKHFSTCRCISMDFGAPARAKMRNLTTHAAAPRGGCHIMHRVVCCAAGWLLDYTLLFIMHCYSRGYLSLWCPHTALLFDRDFPDDVLGASTSNCNARADTTIGLAIPAFLFRQWGVEFSTSAGVVAGLPTDVLGPPC